MSFWSKAGRCLRNIFRQWAAGMNSGERYDQGGRVIGYHQAEYKQEGPDGETRIIPAQDLKAERWGNRIVVFDKPSSSENSPPSPG